MKNLPKEASAYLQLCFNQDAKTIEAWFEIVCKAYPYLHSFSLGFLRTAMGGLVSAQDAGMTSEQWAVMTARNNSHLLDEN